MTVPVLCYKGRLRGVSVAIFRRTPLYPFYDREKPVASARDGLDKAIAVAIISQNLPQDKDVLTQVALFHKALGPEGLH